MMLTVPHPLKGYFTQAINDTEVEEFALSFVLQGLLKVFLNFK